MDSNTVFLLLVHDCRVSFQPSFSAPARFGDSARSVTLRRATAARDRQTVVRLMGCPFWSRVRAGVGTGPATRRLAAAIRFSPDIVVGTPRPSRLSVGRISNPSVLAWTDRKSVLQ